MIDSVWTCTTVNSSKCSILGEDQEKTSLQCVVQIKFVQKYGNAFVTAPIAKEDQLKPGKSDDSTAGQVSGKRAIEQKVQHCVLF